MPLGGVLRLAESRTMRSGDVSALSVDASPGRADAGRLRRLRLTAPRRQLPARGGSGMRSNRFRALWRMRSFLRPYRGQVLVMFACAALSVGASIVIPLIAKAIVNGPIRHGDRGTL